MKTLLDDVASTLSKVLGTKLGRDLSCESIDTLDYYNHRALHVAHITCYTKDLKHAWILLIFVERPMLEAFSETMIEGLDLDDIEVKEDVMSEMINQLAGNLAPVFKGHGYSETDISLPNLIQPTREVQLATLNNDKFQYYLIGEGGETLELAVTGYETISFD